MATTIPSFGQDATDTINTRFQAIHDAMTSTDPGAAGQLFTDMAMYDNCTTALGDGKKAHEKENQQV